MKKYLGYILVFIILGLGGYFILFSGQTGKTDSKSLVPRNALLIWESNGSINDIQRLENYTTWNSIKSLPIYINASKKLAFNDTLDILKQLLEESELSASLHITSNNDLDFIYYLKLNSNKARSKAESLLDQYQSQRNAKRNLREFQGIEISSIQNENEVITFIYEKECLIFSYTPFLIEDVIRHIENKEDVNFHDQFNSEYSLSKSKNDEGDVWLNNEMLSAFYSCFLPNNDKPALALLNNFAPPSFYNVSIDDKKILLNGSTKSAEKSPYFLDIFRNQKTSDYSFSNLIPMNTALLMTFSANDGLSFQRNLKTFFQKNELSQIVEEWNSLNSEKGIFIDKFYDFMDGQFAMATLETFNNSQPNQLFYFKSSKSLETFQYLKDVSEKFSQLANTEVIFNEDYRGNEITEMMRSEFPSLLFGPYFSGFPKAYFFKYNDVIIFTNSVQSARQLIDDILDEKVWGKSVKQNLFLEQTIQSSNVNIFINTARSWHFLKQSISENWKPFLNENDELIKSFELISIQYAFVKNNFYSGAIIQQKDVKLQAQKSDNQFKNPLKYTSPKELITKPIIVRNHITNKFEVLVQNKDYSLNLVSGDGKNLWSYNPGAKINQNNVYQVDLYKNGKLQYAFTTDKKLIVLDRNGEMVEGFPVPILKNNNSISYFNKLDYDNSKNYRFIFSDNTGNIFLTDKSGTKLKGWDPIILDQGLSSLPQHIRLLGKDVIVLLTKDGKLFLKKRNGDNYPNFPVDLLNKVETDFYISLDKNFKTSSIVNLDKEGLLKYVNFEGRIIKDKQFFKPKKDSKFALVNDALIKSFVITRTDEKSITLFNSDGKELLNRDVNNSANLDVQFYNFGADHEIYIIHDWSIKKSFLYNAKGQIIFKEGISNTQQLAMLYYDSDEIYHLYRVFDNELSLITFGD